MVENNMDHSKKHNLCVKSAQIKERGESLMVKQKSNNVETSATENAIVDDDNKNRDMQPSRAEEASNVTSEEKLYGCMRETDITIIDDSECEIINEKLLKRKPNEKLAPLFTKRRRIAAARRSFLQSDITDSGSKSEDRRSNNSGIPILPFPVISHVTQLEDNSNLIRSEFKYKFPTKADKRYSPLIDVNKYKCITNYNEVLKATVTINVSAKENFDQVLSDIEERCSDARSMWKTILTIKDELDRKNSSSRVKSGKAKSSKREATLAQNIKDNQSHDSTWTCKYRPMSTQDVVGNEEAARKLKDWLNGWRTSLTRENDSSSDEFYSSDCSYTSFNNENNQVAVLLGPHGSGKSASVYATAEELGYRFVHENLAYNAYIIWRFCVHKNRNKI